MERLANVNLGGLIYTVTSSGKVLKRRSYGFIKCFPDKDGYLKVSITKKDNRTYNEFLHRVIYRAFNGDIPEGMTVDHIDEDRLNNELDNLQLMSAIDNAIKGNARNWVVISPDGEEIQVYNLTAFCKENGLHAGHMYEVAKGKPKYQSHKGWRCYEHG